MRILVRMCTSLDGFISTPDALPVQLTFDGWDAGALGFYELQARCDAVLMGRTTFEPALGAPHWPWGDLPVFVLGGHRPPGTPDQVVLDKDLERIVELLREKATDEVHLVGGPQTIAAVHALGALDEVRPLVLPVLSGSGRCLTPELNTTTGLRPRDVHRWPSDVVELVYDVERRAG
jgi:dihydrofolate reductase